MPNLVEIGPVVLEKKFQNLVDVFSLFRNYYPLEKGVVLKIGPAVLEQQMLISLIYVLYFIIISP